MTQHRIIANPFLLAHLVIVVKGIFDIERMFDDVVSDTIYRQKLKLMCTLLKINPNRWPTRDAYGIAALFQFLIVLICTDSENSVLDFIQSVMETSLEDSSKGECTEEQSRIVADCLKHFWPIIENIQKLGRNFDIDVAYFDEEDNVVILINRN